jgi:sugar phosphate isomerase/epimerase
VELEASGELLPQKLTQTGRREINNLLKSHDLAACALVCPLRRGLDDPADLEPRLEQIRLTMALAFDLGPRLVIIAPGRISKDEGGRMKDESESKPPSSFILHPSSFEPNTLMKESLAALGKHGDRTGVTLALDIGLDAPETVTAILDTLDVGSLAVNFNPANLVISGHNPHDAIKTLHRRIAHIHAQDARRISPNKMATVPVGHGDIDWLQLATNLDEVEYRGYVTAVADDSAELTAAVDFLRRVMV